MKPADARKQTIMQKLQSENRVYVSELSRRFDISEVTIRKDLKELEDRGLLKRTYGGATIVDKVAIESTLDVLQTIKVEEKKRIARAAYDRISENDAILMDASTTTRELAYLIRDGHKRLTVVTTAIQIALELAHYDHIEVIQIGGLIRRSLFTAMGPLATAGLRSLHTDKAFMGVNGIDINVGLTTQNLFECEVKRLIIEACTQSYVLADASKMRCVSLGVICPVNRVDFIVTDSSISLDFARELEGNDVGLIVAE